MILGQIGGARFELRTTSNEYDGREHVTIEARDHIGQTWDLVSFYIDDAGRLCLTRHESVGDPENYATDELGRLVPDDEVTP
jgi:hypothetical protein